MATRTHFGILLTDQAYEDIGEALKPYVQQGPIGRYLYAESVENQGNFILLTILPTEVQNRITCPMTIWIPTQYVKFVVGSERPEILGFSSNQTCDDLIAK